MFSSEAVRGQSVREFIDYKTSISQTKTPCGGGCSTRISVSLTHYTFLKKGDGGANLVCRSPRKGRQPREHLPPHASQIALLHLLFYGLGLRAI